MSEVAGSAADGEAAKIFNGFAIGTGIASVFAFGGAIITTPAKAERLLSSVYSDSEEDTLASIDAQKSISLTHFGKKFIAVLGRPVGGISTLSIATSVAEKYIKNNNMALVLNGISLAMALLTSTYISRKFAAWGFFRVGTDVNVRIIGNLGVNIGAPTIGLGIAIADHKRNSLSYGLGTVGAAGAIKNSIATTKLMFWI